MTWRENPLLKDKFHQQYPDDIEAIVHEGFRASTNEPEVVWIRITDMNGQLITAELLNQPTYLHSFKAGTTYSFLLSASGKIIFVTPQYLKEISDWTFHACEKCANDVLFDTPSKIQQIAFPNLPEGAVLQTFTTFCPLCGSAVALESKDVDDDGGDERPAKKWYEFWK